MKTADQNKKMQFFCHFSQNVKKNSKKGNYQRKNRCTFAVPKLMEAH